MTIESDSATGWETDETYYYRTGSRESIATAVVRAVGEVSGRSPLAMSEDDALEPLFETIDPDALDSLFRGSDEEDEPTGSVRFEYCGYDVTVDSTGLVAVNER